MGDQAFNAVLKHGSAVDAVLQTSFESWPVDEAFQLFAVMAKEIALNEKKRQAEGQTQHGSTR